jgi:hypothetical protein
LVTFYNTYKDTIKGDGWGQTQLEDELDEYSSAARMSEPKFRDHFYFTGVKREDLLSFLQNAGTKPFSVTEIMSYLIHVIDTRGNQLQSEFGRVCWYPVVHKNKIYGLAVWYDKVDKRAYMHFLDPTDDHDKDMILHYVDTPQKHTGLGEWFFGNGVQFVQSGS